MTTNNTTNTTTTATPTTIATLLANRHRDVQTVDTVTGATRTALRSVNLRRSDFADKAEWQGYRNYIVALAHDLEVYAQADTDNAAQAARKAAIDVLQQLYNYLHTVAKTPAITAQKIDFSYIANLQARRKLDKDTANPVVLQKSLAALQGLVEDCVYWRVNGKRPPKLTQTAATQKAAAAMAEYARKQQQAAKKKDTDNAAPHMGKAAKKTA